MAIDLMQDYGSQLSQRQLRERCRETRYKPAERANTCPNMCGYLTPYSSAPYPPVDTRTITKISLHNACDWYSMTAY